MEENTNYTNGTNATNETKGGWDCATSVHIIYKELSYAVTGCAQRVHSALGPGFPESVYHKALCRELMRASIPFVSQAEFEVAYEGLLCGQFRVDLFVDGKIIVELKAVEALCKEHAAQVLAYLRASNARLGLLMNFGQARLQVRRVVN